MRSGNNGFTLIELSIVLVIIGLLVAGILVGQDLIRAAEIRAGVTQLEKYESAVNTFRSKYNCLPGDCPHVCDFGLGNAYSSCANDNGDGDGEINDGFDGGGRVSDQETSRSAEAWNFWYNLAAAGLISDTISGASGAATTSAPFSGPNPGPVFVVNKTSYVWPWHTRGRHYWSFLSRPGINNPSGYHFGWPFAPLDAFQLDTKLDDGMPMDGTVRAATRGPTYGFDSDPDFNSPTTGAEGTAVCVNSDLTPLAYNATNENPLCNLTIRTSF